MGWSATPQHEWTATHTTHEATYASHIRYTTLRKHATRAANAALDRRCGRRSCLATVALAALACGPLLLLIASLLLPAHLAPLFSSFSSPRRAVCAVLDQSSFDEGGSSPSVVRLLVALARQRNATAVVLLVGEPVVGPSIRWRVEREISREVEWRTLSPTSHRYEASSAVRHSFRVHEEMAAHMPLLEAVLVIGGTLSYYALLARGQGLALANASVIVILPPQQPERPLGQVGASLQDLEVEHMQRFSLSVADAVVGSQRALEQLALLGWRQPARGRSLRWSELEPGSGESLAASDAAHDGGGGVHAAAERVPSLGTVELAAELAHVPSGAPPRVDADDVRRGRRGRTSSILVTVCIVHHERGRVLLQTLDSVREQTLLPWMVEVVVVDDGSRRKEPLALLVTLADWPEFASGAWQLLRRPPRYLGASRNDAVRHARGEYVYFLDDDNVLKPHALETLVGAARVSGAHVLTSLNEKWPSERRPPAAAEDTERFLPLGGAAVVGVFKNCFGDASALVRRDAFDTLGGFTQDINTGHEDWELWARAVLRGFRLEVVPEALYWYRLGPGGMLAESLGGGEMARVQLAANHERNLRPYVERLAGWPEAQALLRLAQGMYDAAQELHR